MNARNIFIVAMLVLVVALFLYLFGVMGAKHEGENITAAQPAVSAEESSSGAGDAQSMTEADTKLQELKEQQGAAPIEGLSILYLVKCSSCHGRDGRGPVGPSIVGKSQEENMAVLMKYKLKQVPNSAMLGLLEKTSDEELEMLAKEIAAF